MLIVGNQQPFLASSQPLCTTSQPLSAASQPLPTTQFPSAVATHDDKPTTVTFTKRYYTFHSYALMCNSTFYICIGVFRPSRLVHKRLRTIGEFFCPHPNFLHWETLRRACWAGLCHAFLVVIILLPAHPYCFLVVKNSSAKTCVTV